MSDLGVPGISSQFDQYIDRLVDLAKVRRRPLEERLDQTKLRGTVWTDLNMRLLRLQEAGSRLYGLNNVFGDRIATSSNENVAIVRPRRNIEPMEMNIQVQQIAAADRFSSQPVHRDLEIEQGNYLFLVGEQEIAVDFEGGTLTEFTQALNQVDSDILRASMVQSSATQQTWFLESRVLGEENGINFQGKARELAFALGLITDQVELRWLVESDTRNPRSAGAMFDPNAELVLNAGRSVAVGIETQEDRIVEGATLRIAYHTQARDRPNVTFVSQGGGHNAAQNAEQALAEGRLTPVAPANIPFDLPVARFDNNVYIRINDRLVELSSLGSTVGDNGGTLEVSLDAFVGQRLQGLVFNNQDDLRDITLTQVNLSLPNVKDWSPRNAVSRAADAEFNIDGVPITRDSNVIEDLVPGQTIELRSASPEIVQLNVRHDVESVHNAIDEFILTYNWTVAHINFATAQRQNEAVIDSTVFFFNEQEMENARKILGIMQGDQQLNGLKTRMHMQMIAAHPVGPEGDRQMSLSEMGISTRRLGGTATMADRLGYFDIHDRNRFNEALANRWDDVRDLFARDPVLGVFESGVVGARESGIVDISRSYTQAPQGVITLRTRQIGTEIERHEKALQDFDDDLDRRRQQWQRDFAEAENAQRELERIQNQIEGINRSQRR